MSTSRIGKAIKESCKDDEEMKNMLLEFLDFNMRAGEGRTWYKEEYKEILKKYSEKED